MYGDAIMEAKDDINKNRLEDNLPGKEKTPVTRS